MRRLSFNTDGQLLLSSRAPQGHWAFRGWAEGEVVKKPQKSPRLRPIADHAKEVDSPKTTLERGKFTSGSSKAQPVVIDRHERDTDCPCGGCVAWGEARRSCQSDIQGLRQELLLHGVNTQAWGQNGNKTVLDLMWEKKKGHIELRVDPKTGRFTRFTRQLQIKVFANLRHSGRGDCVLMNCGEELFGEKVAREGKHIINRIDFDANWQDECKRVLHGDLGLEPMWQDDNLILESHSSVEEHQPSWSYPGLWTIYTIDEVVVRVKTPETVGAMGLPFGNDFITETFRKQLGSTKKQMWQWLDRHEPKANSTKKDRRNRRVSLMDPLPSLLPGLDSDRHPSKRNSMISARPTGARR